MLLGLLIAGWTTDYLLCLELMYIIWKEVSDLISQKGQKHDILQFTFQNCSLISSICTPRHNFGVLSAKVLSSITFIFSRNYMSSSEPRGVVDEPAQPL